MTSHSVSTSSGGCLIGWTCATAALVWLVYPTLIKIADSWYTEQDSQHGLLVMALALAVAWHNKQRLLSAEQRPGGAGSVAVLGMSGLLYALTRVADLVFASQITMLVLLAGVILYTQGLRRFRTILFPSGLLLFALPVPDFAAEYLTVPLQLWSTRLAAALLGFSGSHAMVDGTHIMFRDQELVVAAACSGLRSITVLMAIAALMGYFLPGSFSRKVLLFALSFPVALIANAIRVAGLCVLFSICQSDHVRQAFHDWSSVALVLLSSCFLTAIWYTLKCRPTSECTVGSM